MEYFEFNVVNKNLLTNIKLTNHISLNLVEEGEINLKNNEVID